MARTRALQDLRSDVRFQADIEGNLDRHPDGSIDRLINESWQALREMVSENGERFYLKSATGTLTAGVTGSNAFGSLALPADCERVYGLDVVVNGRVCSLRPASFDERNDYQESWWSSDKTGTPEAWAPYNMGTESTTAVTAGAVALMPAPDLAYSYVLWYLPSWVDRENETDVFDGLAGWERWVVWDCVVKLSARDNDRANTYAIAVQERARLEQVIRSGAKTHRAGPLKRSDARTRHNQSRRSRWL